MTNKKKETPSAKLNDLFKHPPTEARFLEGVIDGLDSEIDRSQATE